VKHGTIIALGIFLAGAALTGRAAEAAQPEFLRISPQSSALFQCGPTTLAAVLAFHGTTVPEAAISEAIYSPSARGALLTDLAWYARSQGYATELRTGTPEDLQNAVAAGHPPIVLLDLGLGSIRRPHFTAVTAWAVDKVRYQGRQPNGVVVAQKKFIRQWQRAGNQYLLIRPGS
jgi:hypothetical protein